MPQWTEQQLKVIGSDKKEIMCSAAAGSGKTAVLVERVVRMFRDGFDPFSFLIITFTNAAASEMKEKIRSRMMEETENQNIRRAYERCDEIQISTIHAFCQQLIRYEFQSAGLDPLFSICDKNQQQTLFHEAFCNACNTLSDERNESYQRLTGYFEFQDAEEYVLELYIFIMSLPDPFGWLEHACENIPGKIEPDHPWYRTVLRMIAEKINACRVYLNEMEKLGKDENAIPSYVKVLYESKELLSEKEKDLTPDAWKDIRFARLSMPRNWKTEDQEWKDRYQDVFNKFKNEMKEISLLLNPDPEKTFREFGVMKDILSGLRLLTVKTSEFYKQLKKEKNLADFHDLEHDTLRILTDDVCLNSVRSRYRYIFVDECQDVSAVQDAIIQKLKGPESWLFMVGDVKQSIYRFRLADPTLFLERLSDFREHPDETRECLFLQSNFRSRPEILETVNTVFRCVMKKEAAELDYTDQEMLIAGRTAEGYCPVLVDILKNDKEECSDLEAEADHITEQIRNLLTERFPDSRQQRNYEYRDIVILMPAVRTDGKKLTELLESRGIPVFFDGEKEYYSLPEISEFRNLLELLVNPYHDIALISVLKATPFFFTDQELSEIRMKKSGKGIPFSSSFDLCCSDKTALGIRCHKAREEINRWRMISSAMKLSDLIWYLFGETGCYAIAGSEDNGAARQANLRILSGQALEAEKKGILTIDQFLGYMNEQESSGDQQTACMLGEKDNLVRIMTIHKSKGLQFPVVICLGLDKSPLGQSKTSIRLHPDLGVLLHYKNPEMRVSRETAAGQIFRWRKQRDEISEKIRLLYVAMTRAQERMFLVTCKPEDPLWSLPDCGFRITSAKSYIDWVMPALLDAERQNLCTGCSQGEMPWEIRVFDHNQQKIVETEQVFHNMTEWLDSVLSSDAVDELWNESAERSGSRGIIKRSVTGLLAAAQVPPSMITDDEETAEGKRLPDAIERALDKYEITEYPQFMLKDVRQDGAFYGTLVHKLLSVLDLDRIRHADSPGCAVEEEKTRLLLEKVFQKEEAERIRTADIVAFFGSSVGKRMLASDDIRREWEFSLCVHRDRDMLLQGVIDCAFREDGEWVIIDYKTDRVDDIGILRDRYGSQVAWYAEALEQLTGIRVKERILWSLALGRELTLDR